MYSTVALLGFLVASIALATRRFNLLSRALTVYLQVRDPIKSTDGRQNLPTLPFVWPNGQGNVEKYLRGRQNSIKWGAEYGSLYRIWSGFHGEIILTNPTDIETVFRDSHTHIKASANDSGHYMYQLLGICLGLVSKKEWQSLRKATEAPFTRTATTTYVDRVLTHANKHVASLMETKSSEIWLLRPSADLRVYPFLALADLLYGELTPALKVRLLEIIPGRDSVFAHMLYGGITRYAWAKYLPIKPNLEMRTFKQAWGKWNDDAHAEALRKGEPAPIVEMYSHVAQGTATREALLQTLDEMLFANLDVTIGALAWAFVFIAAYPHVQARLLSEIKAAATDPETNKAYLMSQSNYLHHILLEGGRLRPVAAFSVAQACPTARQVGEFYLPAGSKFVVDAHALNVRDPLWGPDNTTFRPERWAEGGVQRAKDVRYCYWRFGFGPRVCLGKYVVDLMMKAIIVEVVKGWEVKLENERGESWKWDEDTWSVPAELRIACVKRTE
ncbi:cytochrome P450 [Plenodomus tracheiphilus IPT5]|uniref:Cytochrome P450 n=1 Tax=Plenodomus tracheiphilus IPT5 TaxID=1408161 RepID=A0A6A7B5E6_9PLEO|nr:cytochrome P450 [Plenodomus tracheiphilus IPT5]